ncbi:putative cysteine-rich receptor-like protein kinase 9 [Cucumis melo var. makuwa]|uniref:Cysteine-rich receptor-like protein kinase 9 n=1 Tax=Cucumis melo var. makuwa TaxID=1194695 RepID=A0A5D3BKY8_CUCMM|nr:putative cysteine-rich receptor-like protein kinase 9 [Cucumis melo var. makuwa]TYJ99391.1 putative cysteine-rich receptor-like protein kinase 9 [Cucumis melo var. makuwa]
MESTFVMFVVFFLLSFPIHGRRHRISSDQYLDNPFRYCSNATFSPNSTYFSNLKSLSSSLSSNASHRFYHHASATTVYGDYQCRGDLNATACQHCVAKATTNFSQMYCPFSVEAVIWKDECFLRYSNRSFFSLLREEPLWHINNQENFTGDGVERFKKIVESTLNDTVRNASSSSSSSSHVRLFGTKEASFWSETVYTLAQCTSDLSTSNCRKCLKRAVQIIPSCCSGRRGARVLLFSCTVRYELYPFYNGVSLSNSLSPPPAVSPPAPELAPPEQSPSDSNDPSPELPPPAQSPSNLIPPPPPDTLPSSTSIPLPPSTAPSSLLSGKGKKITVGMVIGIVVGSFFV